MEMEKYKAAIIDNATNEVVDVIMVRQGIEIPYDEENYRVKPCPEQAGIGFTEIDDVWSHPDVEETYTTPEL